MGILFALLIVVLAIILFAHSFARSFVRTSFFRCCFVSAEEIFCLSVCSSLLLLLLLLRLLLASVVWVQNCLSVKMRLSGACYKYMNGHVDIKKMNYSRTHTHSDWNEPEKERERKSKRKRWCSWFEVESRERERKREPLVYLLNGINAQVVYIEF